MTTPRAATGNGSLLWAQGLACGGIVAFAPGLGLLLVALLWPVGLALVWDKSPGRPMARAAALCAAAAALQPIRSAWTGGLGLESAVTMATDIHALALTWCAAAGGWALALLAPIAARAVLEAGSATRAARLRAERARLLAAWRWEDAGSDPGL